ncbi:hypothetical protein H4R18_002180 [Coemansia javaensis]|uniref:Extracellular membrane protein CFEM domain-containing protein n=1 Tax=Coemansia javaensis TaxID=2761396 RepID=A0A9W8HCY9_9FUNG|nr:hypothetical protein H4R18_002180 [Coemansia javaensis]
MLSKVAGVFAVAAAIAGADQVGYVQQQMRAAGGNAGCALAEQVRQCVNHSSMQRSVCAADDLDCQCLWASHITTCFAPCTADKVFSDGMHVAQADQLTICAQAAKFGPAAKEKERLKAEERANRGKKKPETQQLQQPSAAPRNINDINAAHEAPAASASDDAEAKRPAAPASAAATPAAGDKPKGAPARSTGARPSDHRGPANQRATAAAGAAAAAAKSKNKLGGDKAVTVTESSATSAAVHIALGLGCIALAAADQLF